MAKNLTINIKDTAITSYDDSKDGKGISLGSITPSTLDTKLRSFFDVDIISDNDSPTIIAGGSDTGTASSTGTSVLGMRSSTGVSTDISMSSKPTDDVSISGIVYTEPYQFGKEVTVIHYGINSNRIEIKTASLALSSERNILGQPTQVIIIEPKKIGVKKTPSIGKDTATQRIQDEDVQHHPLEKSLLAKAITYLLSEKDTRTVVVDIFARDTATKAVKIKDGKVEIHAVVLYKNGLAKVSDKHQISVIDPSNLQFSSHLSSKDIREHLKDMTGFDKIITLSSGLKIYQAPDTDKVGHESNKWRDCVDIAVKLAFGFNEAQQQPVVFEKAQLKAHPVIKRISNVTEIDKCFFASDFAFRIKQSSNLKVIKKVYKFEEVISKNMKALSEFSTKQYESIITKHEELLKTEDESYNRDNPTMDRLIEMHEIIVTELTKGLVGDHEELLSIV